MPNTKSAKKRHKQSLVRRTRNRAVKSSLRTQIRKLDDLLKSTKLPEADAEFRLVAKHLDQAASDHVIHANRAARVKSRLSVRLKSAKKK